MTDEAEARLGSKLGNYLLREVIGRGGMGVVYAAQHVFLNKPVAVKVLHSRYFDQPQAKARFLREAQTASLIDHPNIVGVTDFGEAPDGTVFLVMAHVEGVGLDRVLRMERTVALFRTISIIGQMTRALAAAHAKGVVHRDLKPENIMLQSRPGRREIVRSVRDERGVLDLVETEDHYDFVTVLDFGAAKLWRQSMAPFGENSTVVGTPAYMAPETARTGVADTRSDIYSVGVIFYEMLTGTVPFDGKTAVDIMMSHVNDAPEPPTRRNPHVEITPAAEATILRALAKDPAQRQASMDELFSELGRCYGQVRFRRPNQSLTPGVDVVTLRRPIPLTPEKVKRRPTPEQPIIGARPAPAAHDPSSGPLLLTKRKSGKHRTLSFGVQPPDGTPGPDRKL